MDPITLVAMAASLGASAAARDTMTSATKDAYQGLKRILSGNSVDLSGLERRPASIPQQDALREDLEDLAGAGSLDDGLFDAAAKVVEAVATNDPDAAGGAGLDLDGIQSEFERVERFSPGSVRITENDVPGSLDISEVRTGSPQTFWQDWAVTSDKDLELDTYTLSKGYLRRQSED